METDLRRDCPMKEFKYVEFGFYRVLFPLYRRAIRMFESPFTKPWLARFARWDRFAN